MLLKTIDVCISYVHYKKSFILFLYAYNNNIIRIHSLRIVVFRYRLKNYEHYLFLVHVYLEKKKRIERKKEGKSFYFIT